MDQTDDRLSEQVKELTAELDSDGQLVQHLKALNRDIRAELARVLDPIITRLTALIERIMEPTDKGGDDGLS